jgi:hypothetical protein
MPTPISKKGLHVFASTVLFLSLLFSCANTGTPPESPGAGAARADWGMSPPSPRDMARHVIDGARPFEWWYFDGHLDTGETFVGSFLDPSFTTGKPGVVFSLYRPDWTKESHMATFSDGEMRVSTDDVDIECPAGYVHRLDAGSYRVGWDIDGLRVDLTLTTLAPGWMPSGADGVNTEKMDFFWAVHQGRNRLEGTIARDGTIRRVSGEGYADHNWGRKPLNEIARSWIWGRLLSGRYTIVYADVQYRDPAIISRPLYIAKDDRMIVGSGSPVILQSDFEMHPVLRRPYPRRIDIDYAGRGIEAHLQIRFKQRVEDVDILTVSGLNGFSQWVARTFFSRPTYFRIVADYDGEIIESGVPSPLSGECLYEVMGLE